MNPDLPYGKGQFIWRLDDCESFKEIVSLCISAKLQHVLIKIADGPYRYNKLFDVPLLVKMLQAEGIMVVGWQYIYGVQPGTEAQIAVAEIERTGVDGFVVDVEKEFKATGKNIAATTYMSSLRASLGMDFPIGLSSYRYPSWHPIPWTEFIAYATYVMPQVYWQDATNPREQLKRSHTEYQIIAKDLPFIPTGAAYQVGSWAVKPVEVVEFLNTTKELGLQGANFWEWAHTRKYLPAVWDAIASYQWEEETGDNDMLLEKILEELTEIGATTRAAHNLLVQWNTEGVPLKKESGTNPPPPPPPPPPDPISVIRVRVTRPEGAVGQIVLSMNKAEPPRPILGPPPMGERIKWAVDTSVVVLANKIPVDSGKAWQVHGTIDPKGRTLYLRDIDVVKEE